jgi:hypothetical protein
MKSTIRVDKEIILDITQNSNLLDPIRWGILQAVAYSDIFNYPITVEEIHRYLVGIRAPIERVQEALTSGNLVPHHIVEENRYFMLAGREHIIENRLRRARFADDKWAQAICYGSMIASFPFVRMVSVTGALALDNVEVDADLDFLIVTYPGRLWLSRALTLLIVRLAKLSNVEVCPNYFLNEHSLLIHDKNLFTARELAQMVPLYGRDIYTRMRIINEWIYDYLPNADGLPPRASMLPIRDISFTRPIKTITESMLRSSPGSWLETWEMQRKIRKLTINTRASGELLFNANVCKGHFHNHGANTIAAYEQRITRLLNPESP